MIGRSRPHLPVQPAAVSTPASRGRSHDPFADARFGRVSRWRRRAFERDDGAVTRAPTVVVIGTLDTKGPEHGYVRDRLRDAGVNVTLVDVGVLGGPTVDPDVAADEVARAAGTTVEELRSAGSAAGHRGLVLESMARGAVALVDRWRSEGRCDGVMGLGGSGGAFWGFSIARTYTLSPPEGRDGASSRAARKGASWSA